MKHHPGPAFLLLLAVGTGACAGHAADGATASPMPGRPTESVSVRAFYSGFSLRQIVVVERVLDNGFFSRSTVSHVATRHVWNAHIVPARDFSFQWHTPDSLIIRSPQLGDMVFVVSENTLLGGRETFEPR